MQIAYRLPKSLRARLKEPLGPIVDEEQLLAMEQEGRLGRPLICVGDMVCETLLRLGFEPKVLVYDLVTLRGPVPGAVEKTLTEHGSRLVEVQNPPATVTRELEEELLNALARDETTRIRVDGEEDLAGLPAIIHAPEGATMIYGMPNQGLVPVSVTGESRSNAAKILSLMKVGPEQSGSTEGG